MYVICVYDVESRRCNKYLKLFRRYLFHTQNSVFEGELTKKQYDKMIEEMNKFRKKEDKITVYFVYKQKELYIDRYSEKNNHDYVF